MDYVQMYRQACAYAEQGRYFKARNLARKSLEARPDHVKSLELLGFVLFQINSSDGEAEQYFRRGLELEPHNHRLYNNLGTVAWERKQFDLAKQYFNRAIKLKPNMGQAYANLAKVLIQQNDMEPAVDLLRKSALMNPRAIKVKLRLCALLEELGRYDEALPIYNEIICRIPDQAIARFNRGLLQLKLGNYREGWRDHEWRYSLKELSYPPFVDWLKPEWSGESIEGKSLLISQEQGYGDAIQMIRYASIVKSLGAEVVVRCDSSLHALFELSPDIGKIVDINIPLQELKNEFNIHIPMMSLPYVTGTEFDSIPTRSPYVFADPNRVQYWKSRINNSDFNIGLVWSGNPIQHNNSRRSCALKDYLPLMRVPGVRIYSLQKNDPDCQLEKLNAGVKINDFMPEVRDFADTAALIKCLDLVISIDTSVAHLSGALAHPTWTILCSNHCWRYALNTPFNPWYPTMRLFRQPARGDWRSTIRDVVCALTSELKKSESE